MSPYAQDFYEIQETVAENDELREYVLNLVADEPIPGKVTDGGERVKKLRDILCEFFEAAISLEEGIQQISEKLPRHESRHAGNNRVFPDGWQKRLARTQISRFYNQAVLQLLQDQGEEKCFIPQSTHQDQDSPCTIKLAGGTADIDVLLDRLNRAYKEGEWHDEVMIPEHPYCTHTVTPVDETVA